MEDAFDLPVLAELPSVASTVKNRRRGASRNGARLDPVAYVVAKPLSRFAEAFRNLRAAIATCRPGTIVKVVVLTSAMPGEGKTTTAVCLGRTAALAGARTVVVDCDLRQRSINRMLSVDPPHGLIEVLNGSVALSDALIQDNDTGLMVLPVAKSASTPKDLFGTPAMKQLLSDLRRSFDFVILDTAPTLALSDTRILCPYADATIMLTRWRLTPRRAVRAALKVLDTPDIFVGGAALTRVDLGEQARVGEGAGTYERAYAKYYVG
jgi:capsular exopolysaccharide synthesis family protein